MHCQLFLLLTDFILFWSVFLSCDHQFDKLNILTSTRQIVMKFGCVCSIDRMNPKKTKQTNDFVFCLIRLGLLALNIPICMLTRQGIATVDRSHVGFGTDFMPKTISNTNCASKISKF